MRPTVSSARGQEVAVVAKQLELSERTLQRWRAQYGGLKADDAKRLNELERENARLKRIVADQEPSTTDPNALGGGWTDKGGPVTRLTALLVWLAHEHEPWRPRAV